MTDHPFDAPFTTDTANMKPERIVDRTEELARLWKDVYVRSSNALVVGEDGVGKTCLLHKLRAAINDAKDDSVLIVEMNPPVLRESLAVFRGCVVHDLMAAIGRRIGVSYTDLRRSVDVQPDITTMFRKALQSDINMLRLMITKQTRYQRSKENTFGATLGVAAQVKETLDEEILVGDLTSENFVLVANDVMQLAAHINIKRAIIFYDEANHLPKDFESDLYRQNFEAFAQRNIQFVFTARPSVPTEVGDLTRVFPMWFQLRGFESDEQVRELLSNYLSCKPCGGPHYQFDDSVVSRLRQIANNRPGIIQRIARTCCDLLQREGRRVVTPGVLLDACIAENLHAT